MSCHLTAMDFYELAFYIYLILYMSSYALQLGGYGKNENEK